MGQGIQVDGLADVVDLAAQVGVLGDAGQGHHRPDQLLLGGLPLPGGEEAQEDPEQGVLLRQQDAVVLEGKPPQEVGEGEGGGKDIADKIILDGLGYWAKIGSAFCWPCWSRKAIASSPR